jgi:Kef-type K+ transport system membrane component KefB
MPRLMNMNELKHDHNKMHLSSLWPARSAQGLADGWLVRARASQALSCAAIDDVLAWCVLALASSFAKSGSALMGLYTTLLAAGYVLFMMVVLRPILVLLHRFLVRKQLDTSRYYLALLFILLLGSAFTTEGLGIHCFFGGFVMGLIVPKDGGFADSLVTRMELVVGEFSLQRWDNLRGV